MCDFFSTLHTQFQGLSSAQQFTTVMRGGAGLVGGISQFEAGQAGKSAYGYNARVAMEESRGKQSEVEQKFDRLMGRQASLYAKAGVDISSGSPLLVMTETAREKGQEESDIGRAGREQAALDKYYGKVAAFSGTMGGMSTFLKGLSGALQGMQSSSS
jgi:hypothetical protein